MCKWHYKITIVVVTIMLLLLHFTSYPSFALTFTLVPQEDFVNGRNNNVYLPSIEKKSQVEQEAFVKEISEYAIKANEKWGIPASAMIGMAILESGFGTTRIAYHANNIFGIKVWGVNPLHAWQLVGQPDEDFARTLPTIANLGNDRIVFDETQRRDNWYRLFCDYEEAVNFLAGNLLLNSRYGFAKEAYHQRMNTGWSFEDASKRYLFDIANAGYNHYGGEYYQEKIGVIMKRWNLYQYDTGYYLRDRKGHFAETAIHLAEEKGWMNGYSNGNFRPNESLARAQAATVLVKFLDLKQIGTQVFYQDVSFDHWAKPSIVAVAQHKIMVGTSPVKFSPSIYISRAQMVQILYNAGLYSEPTTNTTSSFKDVSDDHWALVAIETMRNEGIINGFGDDTFRPNEHITRAQMAIVLKNIYEK